MAVDARTAQLSLGHPEFLQPELAALAAAQGHAAAWAAAFERASLEEAVRGERYEEAARLRDDLRRAERGEGARP